MDKTTLVGKGREIEALVVTALSQAKIPVSAVRWNCASDGDAQLVIVTSLYDTKGPLKTYSRIRDAFSSAGVSMRVPIMRLYAKSPEDPDAQELIRNLKSNSEGTIHIVKKLPGRRGPRYSLIFAPYVGTGGAIPSVGLTDDEELRSFLEKRLGIDSYEINRAQSLLSEKGSASIFDVELNLRQAKKLNLAA